MLRARRRLVAALVGALLGTTAAAGLLLAARWQVDRIPGAASPAALASARDAGRRARRFLHPRDPERLLTLERLIAGAEEATRRRDGEAAVAAAWDRALADAFEAVRQVSRERRRAAEVWAGLRPGAEAAVAKAREQATAPGLGRTTARQLREAEIHLALAARAAEAGDLERARTEAEAALASADQVQVAWERLHARFSDPASLHLWRSWAEGTVAESRLRSTSALVIDKLARRLDVYSRGRRIGSFTVEIGARGLERKLHAGDRATPEGRYRVTQVKTGGRTIYYKALLLDYPNAEDRRRFRDAQSRGLVPSGVGIGSLIEIHGEGGQGRDWTDGCIALTNPEMDVLLRQVRVGTPVTIVGTLTAPAEGAP